MKIARRFLILAVVLAPSGGFAESPTANIPRPDGATTVPKPEKNPQARMAELWKRLDADADGFLTLSEFSALPRLKKLPDDKRARLFQRLDKNADGKLARRELAVLVAGQNAQVPPMKRLWALDVDHSGGVSFLEFQAGEYFKKLPLEKQQAMFRRLDRDGDGVISPKDRPVRGPKLPTPVPEGNRPPSPPLD